MQPRDRCLPNLHGNNGSRVCGPAAALYSISTKPQPGVALSARNRTVIDLPGRLALQKSRYCPLMTWICLCPNNLRTIQAWAGLLLPRSIRLKYNRFICSFLRPVWVAYFIILTGDCWARMRTLYRDGQPRFTLPNMSPWLG